MYLQYLVQTVKMPTNGQQLLKTNLKDVIKHPSKRLKEIPNRHKIIEGIADNLK